MKQRFTLIGLLFCSSLFSQWTRQEQLPSSDIFSLIKNGNSLYAGGKGIIYFSKDKGQTWDSTQKIQTFNSVDNIAVYRDELYASSFSIGVYKSTDEGQSWQEINTGLFPHVSDFCEFKGDLYAATLGGSIFKLNPANRSSWIQFSNNLSSLSSNVTSIAANSNSIIAGTLNNGLYDYLAPGTTTWEERFLLGHITPSEGVYDIVTAHDSLFLAGHTGKYYLSIDGGLNWNVFGQRIPSLQSTFTNAKQGLLLSTGDFDGVDNNTFFWLIKKDALAQYTGFGFIRHHFTYSTTILGEKYWDASSEGLFSMPLSALPGVAADDDSVDIVPLPLKFISFNAGCNRDQIILSWKSSSEEEIAWYDLDRSPDRIHWTRIGEQTAKHNTNSEIVHSFADQDPLQDSYYRITAVAFDGRIEYSELKKVSCTTTESVQAWPNPVHDRLLINLTVAEASTATTKLYDSKGSLVRQEQISLVAGVNHHRIEMEQLANGIYHLSVDLKIGQIQKTFQILKQ